MSTEWRVDRTQGGCPVGMVSLVYLGGSERQARRAYSLAQPGRGPWGSAYDPSYGVGLFKWNGRDYVRVAFKTLSPTVKEIPK